MCELFGINSKENVQLNNYLKEFFAHSKAHPHGWGMACMNEREVSIEKEPLQASKSNYLKERLTVPIQAKCAFAHIRYATIGNVDYKNCHPYTGTDRNGRHWTMVHNGTIFKYEPLNPYVGLQIGSTDSERILLYIIDCMNELEEQLGRRAGSEERFRLLDSIIGEMAEGNKLNLLLYDGELFYVHTNYENSLYKLEQKNQIIFSTSPLGKEEWKPVTFTTLLAYRQGKQVYQGTNHGKVYVDNEENLKYLYSIFSDL